jgi:hypothetical protein
MGRYIDRDPSKVLHSGKNMVISRFPLAPGMGT